MTPTGATLAVNFLDAQSLITAFGTIGILAIVFAETGLLLGFFLPGDSLLFIAGYAAAGGIPGVQLSLPVLLIGLPIAAIVGAQTGYYIGRKGGPLLFDRKESRFFKRAHVQKAEDLLERFGPGKAVVMARFVPIARTFMNPVAGVTEMPVKDFTTWNMVGGLLWTVGLTMLGYALGGVEFIAGHIESIVLLVIAISLLPLVVEILRERSKSKAKA